MGVTKRGTITAKSKFLIHRVVAISLFVTSLFTAGVLNSPLVRAALPAPGGIDTGLTTWQKANNGTATNTTWQDSSGNGNTLTGGVTFQGNNINFNPAYNFNGGQWFNAPNALGIAGTNNFSGFMALKQNIASSMVFDGNNGGATENFNADMSAGGNFFVGRSGIAGTCGATTSTALPVGIPGIGTYNRSYPNVSVELNAGGTTSGTCDMNITGATRMIGRRNQSGVGSFFVNGSLGEYILYNRSLSTGEMRRVQSYLAIKYGITLSQTPLTNYVASDGTTFPWNATTNNGFNNNITGIGRDDSSALNQKQSKSVNKQGIVTVGHGNIATDNISNTNNFAASNSFLMFGDDNGSATAWINPTPPSLSNYKQLARTWKVQKTGTVGTLAMSFDVNDTDANIPAPIQDYYLLNLTTGQPFLLSSADGNNYSTSGINISDGDQFTIGTFDAQYVVHYRKTVNPVVTTITPGQTFTYTVTAENQGNVPLTGLSFTDDLSDVVDDATYQNNVNATVGTASYNGGTNHISWSGNLAVGQIAAVTYSFTMNVPDLGNGRLDNGVVSTDPGSNCNEDPAVDPDCMTTTPLPVVTSQKTLVSPTNPKAGDTVNYQFVITNTGAAAATTVPVADDLSQVLDDATYNNNASATSGTLSYNPLTQRLNWSGALAAAGNAGDSVTVTYSVNINAATSLGDAMLNNAVISPDCPNPAIFDSGNPSYEANCVSSTPVAAWMAVKTTNAANGIKPGAVVGYTITVTNTGAVNLIGGNAPALDDDLTDVIDDANVDSTGAQATMGTVSYISPTLHWTGNLNSGQSATIVYNATVKPLAELGNANLANAIGAGPMNCPTVPTTNSGDSNFNASCATLTSIDNADPSVGPDTSPSGNNLSSSLADTGQNVWSYGLLAVILMLTGLGVVLRRKILLLGNKV